MSLLGHNKCCQCADCRDKPTQLVVKVSYPQVEPSTIISAHPDGFWSDVTTDCAVPTHLNGVRHINLTSAGSGYTQAPEIAIEGRAAGFTRIVSSIESVTVTSGGTGYTSPPAVEFKDGSVELAASAEAVIEGKITKVTVGTKGSGYTEPPRIVVCGGTGAELTPVMNGYVDRIEITDFGSGYEPTVKPVVTLAGGGGSGAMAGSSVGRRVVVTGFNVTSPGRGYDQPPEVVVTGAGRGVQAEAIVEFGRVARINLLSQGEGLVESFGASFEMPAVELRRGGGVGAEAEAHVDVGVAWVSLDNKGHSYTTPPEVTISGSATAVSHIKYTLEAVTVAGGGEGYPYQPNVAVLGGGGGPSTASASISGEVVAVQLLSQGRYRNEYFEETGTRTDWPSIAFAGGGGSGAAADPVFQPVPLSMVSGAGGALSDNQDPEAGYGYSAPPVVTITGGGGFGASAVAVLEWSQEQIFRIPIKFCSELMRVDNCLGTQGVSYPGVPCSGCGGTSWASDLPPSAAVRFGESVGWEVRAGLALQSNAIIPSIGVGPGFLAAQDRVFPGEGIWVYAATSWAIGNDLAFAFFGPQMEEVLYVNRLYNRIEPAATYGFWLQPDSATNAVLVPLLRQYSDRKGEPFWFITGFAVQSPGDNLFFDVTDPPPWPGISARAWPYLQETSGNAVSVYGRNWPRALLFEGDELVVAYSPPVVGEWSIAAPFSQMPQLVFTFEQVPGEFGSYRIAEVAVASGGETDAADGMYVVAIESLDHGHLSYPDGTGRPWRNGSLRGQIENGRLASIAVLDAGYMRGGASVTSIQFAHKDIETLEEIPGKTALTRVIVGSSRNQTSVAYLEPHVTATAATSGTPAVFEVVLAESTDAAGKPVWSVASVLVLAGGSGYAMPIPLDFQVQGDNGIEAIAASAYGQLPPRQQPTLTLESSGPGAGAVFELTYRSVAGSDPIEWEIAEVAVTNGGLGYVDYSTAVVHLGEDDHEAWPALAQIRSVIEEPVVSASVSSGTGAELQVVLTPSFDKHWTVESINILSAGAGYENGEPVVFAGGTQPSHFAEATITVGALGEVVAVNIAFGGAFQQDTGVVESVELFSGGAYHKQPSTIIGVEVQYGGMYFDRIITETSTPLGDPPPICIGNVSGGWSLAAYSRTPPWRDGGEEWEKWREVGEQWQSSAQTNCWTGGSSGFPEFTRTRVCPPPTLEISLE